MPEEAWCQEDIAEESEGASTVATATRPASPSVRGVPGMVVAGSGGTERISSRLCIRCTNCARMVMLLGQGVALPLPPVAGMEEEEVG